jgi:hypothetical protein
MNVGSLILSLLLLQTRNAAELALFRDVKSGSLLAAKLDLKRGADLNARESLLSMPNLEGHQVGGLPRAGDTPLILAVRRRDSAMAKLLLANGYKIKLQICS